jgi:nickel-dependent lactate racemase
MAVTALRYGQGALEVELPHSSGFIGVLHPKDRPALADPAAAIAASLARPIDSLPLRDIAAARMATVRNTTTSSATASTASTPPGKRQAQAVIVISDSTRPVPNQLLLPPILSALHAAGYTGKDITILIATGIHRPNEGAELVALVGADIAGRYRIENHFSKDDSQLVNVGTIMDAVPVHINRRYLQSDLKILTGFIEPHMWAGYSGGRKSILPGISSLRTLEYLHGPEMIAHPAVVYGRLAGNPFHEAGLRIMAATGADFVVNVTLDSNKRITGVYSGHPVNAHLRGCAELEPFSTTSIDQPLDFVVTTNGGAPLDVNLYQSAKGIAGVGPVVRPGGDIVIASQCREGLGSTEFIQAMDEFRTPQDWLDRAMRREFSYADQWCAQEIFKWLQDRGIHLYCDTIPDAQLRRYGLQPSHSISDTVTSLLAKHGPAARWAVVPDGPYLILRIA